METPAFIKKIFELDGFDQVRDGNVDLCLQYSERSHLENNIFVANVPQDCSEKVLTEYFNKFGKVLLAKKETTTSAYITYDKYSSAVNALQITNGIIFSHKINGQLLSIAICGSWYPPDVYHYPEKTESLPAKTSSEYLPSENILISKTKPTFIFRLSDDCLENIFDKLELKDQIAFSIVCARFSEVFINYAKLKYKELFLRTLNPLSELETHSFFHQCGRYINKITHDIEPLISLCDLGKYCPNLQHFVIELDRFKDEFFLKEFQHLTELKLLYNSFNDDSVLIIAKLPNLIKLDLSLNWKLEGKHLFRLKTLEELNLRSCFRLLSCYVQEMSKHLTNLRVLDITDCPNLDLRNLKEITDNLLNVDTLSMEAKYSSTAKCFAKLPKLKNLTLDRNAEKTIFKSLIEHKMNQLESLELHYVKNISMEIADGVSQLLNLRILKFDSCTGLKDEHLLCLTKLSNLAEFTINCNALVTDDGLFKFLQTLMKLKQINVTACVRVSGDFIKKLESFLKKTINHHKPIRIVFGYVETNLEINKLNASLIDIRKKDFFNVNFIPPLFDLLDFDSESEGHFDVSDEDAN